MYFYVQTRRLPQVNIWFYIDLSEKVSL